GSFLLSRPFASTGPALNFVDSLFTSTSATCVTGLIVVDTGSSFSTAGQIIILMLIQVGGLGIMSFSTLLLFFFSWQIRYRQQRSYSGNLSLF
ncbi:MAG: hypothetical protein FP814_03210, partial [Desulfobacterium sp.]|nr:hypothetical protein [Desulfobacterium sp.]